MKIPDYQIIQQDETQLAVRITFAADCEAFDGHFDGLKLLPAVAQLFVAEQIATQKWGALRGFGQLKQVKFREPIFPDSTVELTLSLTTKDNEKILAFRYRGNDAIKSSGKLSYSDANNFSEQGMSSKTAQRIRRDNITLYREISDITISGELMRPCLIIPFYNHGQFATQLVRELAPYALPIIIVDDGSDDVHKQQLHDAISDNNIHLITLDKNGGKGKAVITGFKTAHNLGLTHAIQIDADCQHDFTAIDSFLRAAEKNPDAIICGYPIYDKTVPKSRLYPRYINHFWVYINTLSNDIKDSMCGFRCYPLSATLAMLATQSIGQRMDFDIEILVRLYWRGIVMINLPVGVIYHTDASSHFRLWKDNVLISRAHAMLFFGMLKRLPKRLLRGQFT